MFVKCVAVNERALCWFTRSSEVVLYFSKAFAQRLGHDKVHVDGHQQGGGTEHEEYVWHGYYGHHVRERLEHSEHDQVSVRYQHAAADCSDGRGQQFTYHRPREHKDTNGTAEHVQHDATQGPRDGGRVPSTVGGRHKSGRQRHGYAREHQQRFPAHAQ